MSLKQKTIKGTLWSSVENIGKNVVFFLVTIILARLLTPSDFGLIELIIIFTSISQVLLDSGFSQALIRKEDAEQLDFCSVFYFNIFVGIVIYIVLFFFSPFVSSFYDIPELTLIGRVLFLVIIFSSFSIIQTTIASKELNFKPLAISSLLASVISGVASVFMAYCGYGVWSLVIFYLGQVFFRTIFLWLSKIWRPSLLFSFNSIKKLFLFSSNLLANGLLDVIFTNLQSLFIGRFYSRGDLGFYSQAKRLQAVPSQTLVNIVQKVSYSALSVIQNEDVKLRRGYKMIIQITTYVLFPVMFLMLASSETIFSVVLSPKWLPAVEYFRPFCLIGIILPFQSVNTNIFLVKGKSSWFFKLGVIRKLLILASLILAIKISILALVWGLVIAYVGTSILYMYFAGKLINYSLKSQLIDSSSNALLSITSAVPVFYLNIHSSTQVVDLLIQVTVYMVIFVFLSFITKNKSFREMIDVLKNINNEFF